MAGATKSDQASIAPHPVRVCVVDRELFTWTTAGDLLLVALVAWSLAVWISWFFALLIPMVCILFCSPWAWISGESLGRADEAEKEGNHSAELATLLAFLSVQGAALVKIAEGEDIRWQPLVLYTVVAASTLGAMVGIQRFSKDSKMSSNSPTSHRFGKWSLAWGLVIVACFLNFGLRNLLPNQASMKPTVLNVDATEDYKWKLDDSGGFSADVRLEPGIPWSELPRTVELVIHPRGDLSKQWKVFNVALFGEDGKTEYPFNIAFNPPNLSKEEVVNQATLLNLQGSEKYRVRIYLHANDPTSDVQQARRLAKENGELQVLASTPIQKQ